MVTLLFFLIYQDFSFQCIKCITPLCWSFGVTPGLEQHPVPLRGSSHSPLLVCWWRGATSPGCWGCLCGRACEWGSCPSPTGWPASAPVSQSSHWLTEDAFLGYNPVNVFCHYRHTTQLWVHVYYNPWVPLGEVSHLLFHKLLGSVEPTAPCSWGYSLDTAAAALIDPACSGGHWHESGSGSHSLSWLRLLAAQIQHNFCSCFLLTKQYALRSNHFPFQKWATIYWNVWVIYFI